MRRTTISWHCQRYVVLVDADSAFYHGLQHVQQRTSSKGFNVCFLEMHKDVDRGCRSREYARATSCGHPQSHSLKTSFLGRLVTFSCLPSVKARRENKAAGLHFKFLLLTTDQGPGKADDRRRRATKARHCKRSRTQSQPPYEEPLSSIN